MAALSLRILKKYTKRIIRKFRQVVHKNRLQYYIQIALTMPVREEVTFCSEEYLLEYSALLLLELHVLASV
jgi:hypothetical protein